MPSGADSFVQRAFEVIVEPIILVLVASAIVVFIWGLVEFIAGAGSEDKRRTGQKHMLWGIVGFAIMLSVFGIINVINNTIGGDIPVELE